MYMRIIQILNRYVYKYQNLSIYIYIYIFTTTTTASKTIVVPLDDIDFVLKENVPLPLDSTKFILHILLAFFPLGFLHSALPRGIALDIYNLVCGVLLAQFLFAEAWINVGLAALLTQLLVLVLPRSKVGPAVFVLVMAFMVGTMVERLSCDYLSYRMDYTGSQMMATIKLTSFAWFYTDGYSNPDKKKKEIAEMREKLKGDCKEKRRLKSAIKKFENRYDTIPNPLTFMAWTYQFSGYPVGPALELREYLRCTRSNTTSSGVFVGLSKFFAGFGFLALFKILSSFVRSFSRNELSPLFVFVLGSHTYLATVYI